MSRTWSLSLTRRIGNEEAPRRSRHGETRKNRKIVEGENHLTRIKNVFQDSGERAYNAAIPFRGSGKCTWLLSIKMVLAPEKGRKGPRRPRARLPAHSALRWTRSGGRADGLLSADSVAKVPNCPALALLWQIYSRRRSLQIHFRQCGHRCGGSRAKSSRMAWRTAGKVG
jgi:hypothetical protein